MTDEIRVLKRSGELAPLDYNKIHFMLEEAAKGLSGVSVSDVEMDASLKFYDEMPTSEIQENLVKAAVDLIDEKQPNYEVLAARLVNYGLRKDVFGEYTTKPLIDVIMANINRKVYDKSILDHYTTEELALADTFIQHDRDYLFRFAGIQQCVDKYILKGRVTGEKYETPQYMYMMIALTLFSKYSTLYDTETRMDYVRRYYDAISTFRLNLPTPVLCGVRTPLRQYSSCVLVDFDDTMDSIIHSDGIVKKYTSQRAGLGINMGRIRAEGSEIRSGEVIHTGVIPFLKSAEASVRCCTQNGVRGGSATVHFPFYHPEIRDILVLKNNRGTDENRVRKLDYSIQLNETFYKRVLGNKDFTLFSPHEVPELYDNLGQPDEFEKLYVAAEKRFPHNKRINAREMFTDLINERIETGRIYVMNVDHCNTHSSFDVPIRMSNLCLTGDTSVDVTIGGQAMTSTLEEIVDAYISGKTVSIRSKNLESGDVEYKPVIDAAMTAKNAKLIRITDDATGKSITCTPNHKVYTKNRGYVEAGELVETDILDVITDVASESGISIEHLDYQEDVFDITVEDNHNFYANDVLVHNCQEITLPTKPVQDYHDEDGEIALCILSALNLGNLDLNNLHVEMAELCDLAVRGLDEIVDLQEYPLAAARNSTLKRRSLGVGYIGLAHFLAMNKIHYNSQDAIDTMHRVTESFQYHLIAASVELAKLKGKCDGFEETKYGRGILPIDTYKSDVDDICSVGLELDWEQLRSSVKQHGVRNSTLSAQMPSESSSVTSNETNGIELPRSAVTTKKSKQGVLKMVLPEYRKYKEFYTMVWDDDYNNEQYLKVGAVIQKFFDQAISMNDYWNPFSYPDNKLPVKLVMRHLIMAYKLGHKTSYYLNTYDGKAEVDIDAADDAGCDSGACAI